MLALFAIWILINGIDDLFLDLAYLWHRLVMARRGRRAAASPSRSELDRIARKRIAVFVPLWHEHGVIRRMIEYNLSSLGYDRCEFFVGVYPNDELTVAEVRNLAHRFPIVHLSPCPHDGP